MSKSKKKSAKHTKVRGGASHPDRRPKASAEPKADGPNVTSDGHIVGSYSLTREIIESIAIAFVLAFVFRTFEAEVFAIPTGSMAPTLMGRHKDLDCPQCGFRYQLGASSEVEKHSNARKGQVISGACPNCGFATSLLEESPNGSSYTSFGGDRILVSKFPYEYRDPKRWEVAVFHFPGNTNENYIKRIVGLPKEWLRIRRGNIETAKSAEGPFQVERKPDRQLQAMLQTVYDNDYRSQALSEAGWPERWQSDLAQREGRAWTTSDHQRFATDGSEPSARLRYRHIVPTNQEWDYLSRGEFPPGADYPAQLISDFVAYNTFYNPKKLDKTPQRTLDNRFGVIPDYYGVNWVGDLATEFELDVKSEAGTAILELIEGGETFQCRIDVATGQATFAILGDPSFGAPTAETPIRGPGAYRILFSNVDDELRLWVDRDRIDFGTPTTYAELGNDTPTTDDLSPVRIGSDGALVEVDHLKVYRDIYYIASDSQGDPICDLQTGFGGSSEEQVRDRLSKPAYFPERSQTREVIFQIGPDQFFACGDNSAMSLDSRLWSNAKGTLPHTVDRRYLIGKALAVYWPHGWEMPGTGWQVVPNFGGMRLIR